VHVPGKDHAGPYGLSRRRTAPEDEEELRDDWVDEVLYFPADPPLIFTLTLDSASARRTGITIPHSDSDNRADLELSHQRILDYGPEASQYG
jgi:hypothetical protein